MRPRVVFPVSQRFPHGPRRSRRAARIQLRCDVHGEAYPVPPFETSDADRSSRCVRQRSPIRLFEVLKFAPGGFKGHFREESSICSRNCVSRHSSPGSIPTRRSIREYSSRCWGDRSGRGERAFGFEGGRRDRGRVVVSLKLVSEFSLIGGQVWRDLAISMPFRRTMTGDAVPSQITSTWGTASCRSSNHFFTSSADSPSGN